MTPGSPAAARFLALQRDAGNAAATALLRGSTVQRTGPPAPAAAQPVVIGHVYTVRGTIDGEAVVYTGSTAREIAQRLYKDKHTWSTLIKNRSTTIEVHEVKAVLNIQESGRRSLASALDEAKRAAEQVIIKRRRTDLGAGRELNAVDAAEEGNIAKWAERHQVKLGPRVTFRAGVKITGFAALQLLDFFLMYRDGKLAQYAMAPYLLEDENGIFTLQETDRGLFRPNWYWKNYQTGALAGQRVKITKAEFGELREEAELLWGTTDWMGDFVPGLLRRELPVVEVPAGGPEA
ncbi:hypothetical protein BBK82_35090 [Lentzea guizhouensis]|uniref:Uncharacterized protein n=1 Tax=Lentzea guizhouensis TaxID=1586287 RepID=A0A1B2HRW2_9PSEU|nr:hypothetical protein BBK82_35090 [Lentzea guizhouensis]